MKRLKDLPLSDASNRDAETSSPERTTKKGGKRSGAGRRAFQIDSAELEKLCALHCTDQEIASFFGVSVRTIERRKKNPLFAETMERGRAKGRVSLRRSMWGLAMKGNPAANIFLAKNLLGYRDYFSSEQSGPDGGPIPVSVIDRLHQRRDRLAKERKEQDAAQISSEPPASLSEREPDAHTS